MIWILVKRVGARAQRFLGGSRYGGSSFSRKEQHPTRGRFVYRKRHKLVVLCPSKVKSDFPTIDKPYSPPLFVAVWSISVELLLIFIIHPFPILIPIRIYFSYFFSK